MKIDVSMLTIDFSIDALKWKFIFLGISINFFSVRIITLFLVSNALDCLFLEASAQNEKFFVDKNETVAKN